MSVVEGLKKSAAETPAKPACICGTTRLTFREVGERVNRLSSALSGLGIGRGDRVTVLSLNCHRFFELYFGVPQLGARRVLPRTHRELQGASLIDGELPKGGPGKILKKELRERHWRGQARIS